MYTVFYGRRRSTRKQQQLLKTVIIFQPGSQEHWKAKHYSQLWRYLLNRHNPNKITSCARPSAGCYIPVRRSRLVISVKVMAVKRKILKRTNNCVVTLHVANFPGYLKLLPYQGLVSPRDICRSIGRNFPPRCPLRRPFKSTGEVSHVLIEEITAFHCFPSVVLCHLKQGTNSYPLHVTQLLGSSCSYQFIHVQTNCFNFLL